nr:hypothetical protein [Escherichia coli]
MKINFCFRVKLITVILSESFSFALKTELQTLLKHTRS